MKALVLHVPDAVIVEVVAQLHDELRRVLPGDLGHLVSGAHLHGGDVGPGGQAAHVADHQEPQAVPGHASCNTHQASMLHSPAALVFSFLFFLRSSIGGVVAYVTGFNSSATWAATFRLRGYKCMLVIFVFP